MRRTQLRRVTAAVIGFVVLFIVLVAVFRVLSAG
jgi:preprotein translocase subunit SecE